ncbi:MAG: hypothetical protein ABIS18_11405 [Actinomycetota bacterium]
MRRLMASAVLLAVTVVPLLAGSSAVAGPGSATTAIVAMGDSFIYIR